MGKILILDIETAPIKAYVWGLFKQNVGLNMIDRDSYMLSWSAMWLGDKEVMSDSLPEHKSYVFSASNDRHIVESVWRLLDEADIVVAHNGKGFDIPKINARFLQHGIAPPSPYKIVDTLKTARSAFKLTSNKLDYLAQYLGVGKKMSTGGFELWEGCMNSDPKSWKKMVKYNKRDVLILEKVYKKLRPWIRPHPNLALYDDKIGRVCPTCGGHHIQKRGNYMTTTGRYQRYQCMNCMTWSRERTHNQTPEKRKALLNTVA